MKSKSGSYKMHRGNVHNTGTPKAAKHSPVMKGGKSSMPAGRKMRSC